MGEFVKKVYLGDSVYGEFYGYGIKLTTENGKLNDPSNIIYLEIETLINLKEWIKNLNL